MTLRLSEGTISESRREGERAYPAECCGVLVGRPGQIKEVLHFIPAMNRRTDDPHRYLISPSDLQRAELEVRSTGLEVLGFYHSHPDHPAVPSAYDAEHAWPWYSYIIVRVDRGRAAEVSSWQLADDRSAMIPESVAVFSEV